MRLAIPLRWNQVKRTAHETARLPIPKTRNDHSEVTWPTSQPKFIPKKPVRNDKGRKMVAMTVSCLVVSF